uniref:Uncharacterized protein n=1 Tax=Picea glauca TaxID=3330 RepID=A0A101LXI1_PICGL|nr:hypothetical protein ABT39_MTgene5982 [Picea glauca]QHR88504.1 hypothetical protein Q903MT_gene2518 [Picea sitchensis]
MPDKGLGHTLTKSDVKSKKKGHLSRSTQWLAWLIQKGRGTLSDLPEAHLYDLFPPNRGAFLTTCSTTLKSPGKPRGHKRISWATKGRKNPVGSNGTKVLNNLRDKSRLALLLANAFYFSSSGSPVVLKKKRVLLVAHDERNPLKWIQVALNRMEMALYMRGLMNMRLIIRGLPPLS